MIRLYSITGSDETGGESTTLQLSYSKVTCYKLSHLNPKVLILDFTLNFCQRIKYARIWIFCLSTGEYVSVKIHLFTYFIQCVCYWGLREAWSIFMGY